jgi:hypothetical protein
LKYGRIKVFLLLFLQKKKRFFFGSKTMTDAAAEGKNWIASLRSQ